MTAHLALHVVVHALSSPINRPNGGWGMNNPVNHVERQMDPLSSPTWASLFCRATTHGHVLLLCLKIADELCSDDR